MGLSEIGASLAKSFASKNVIAMNFKIDSGESKYKRKTNP